MLHAIFLGSIAHEQQTQHHNNACENESGDQRVSLVPEHRAKHAGNRGHNRVNQARYQSSHRGDGPAPRGKPVGNVNLMSHRTAELVADAKQKCHDVDEHEIGGIPHGHQQRALENSANDIDVLRLEHLEQRPNEKRCHQRADGRNAEDERTFCRRAPDGGNHRCHQDDDDRVTQMGHAHGHHARYGAKPPFYCIRHS